MTEPSPDRSALAAEALARRTRSAASVYIPLAGVIWASSALNGDKSSCAAVLFVGSVVIAAVRLYLTRRYPELASGSHHVWTRTFSVWTLVAALFWSACIVYGLVRGIGQPALLLITTAGIAAGSTTNLSANVKLARRYLFLLLAPLVIAMLMIGSPAVAITVACYFLFLVAQVHHLHREFIDAISRTELLSAQAEALQIAQRSAEDANRAKSTFLANMSHEIRTPLTAIIGYAEILIDANAAAHRIEYAEIIRRNGEHLLQLLNEILDMSKIETGKMGLKPTACDLRALLAGVESLMRVRATNKGLSFVLSAQSSIPSTITTDAVRLKQVLLNLVGNAIKFTDAGEVRIVAQMSSNDSSEPRLEVLVKDTGMGISKDELARLFAPFTQVESNAARAQGTGLGLYLARTLARMMGGDVTVESTLGKGSTFTLMLPIADSDCIAKPSSVEPPSDSHGTEEARLDGLRVLLAEDSVDNQRLISLFLTTAGATVDVVGNGLLVLERVHDAKDHYDVVLMDMEMPELDGYGATARLRALGYRVPIIALTAHAMATHHGRSQAAGCDAHVTKPVDRENLIQVVEQQARKHQDAFATTGYDPRPSG